MTLTQHSTENCWYDKICFTQPPFIPDIRCRIRRRLFDRTRCILKRLKTFGTERIKLHESCEIWCSGGHEDNLDHPWLVYRYKLFFKCRLRCRLRRYFYISCPLEMMRPPCWKWHPAGNCSSGPRITFSRSIVVNTESFYSNVNLNVLARTVTFYRKAG